MRSFSLKTITILITTITLIFLVIIPSLSHALPRVIRIGGLFSAAEQEQELVFHAAIEKVNANFANRTIFEAVVEHARPYNSYEAHFKSKKFFRKFCLSSKTPIFLSFQPVISFATAPLQSSALSTQSALYRCNRFASTSRCLTSKLA